MRAPNPVKWFVFDLVSTDIDYTGGLALMSKIRQLQQQGIVVAFAEVEDVRTDLEQIGALQGVAADHIFETVQVALDAFARR